MENLLFLGVPILKHMRVYASSASDEKIRAWHRGGRGTVNACVALLQSWLMNKL